MKNFFKIDFSWKKFSLLIVLSLLAVGGLYSYHTNASSAFLAKYVKYEKWQNNWQNLNAQMPVYANGLPDELFKPLKGLEGANRQEQIRSLMSIRNHISYENTSVSRVLTPYEVLNGEKGDCDDISNIWHRQLTALGVPSKVLTVLVNDLGDAILHAVVLTENENGEPVVMDINTFLFVAIPFEQWKKQRKAFILYEAKGSSFKRSDSLFSASL